MKCFNIFNSYKIKIFFNNLKCFYNQETNIEMSLFCHFEE
jgi:hypothetical protein